MNRQERRQKERIIESYARRSSFSKSEVEELNTEAYALGVEHALDAVAIVYGLGEVRLARIKEKLELIQKVDFMEYEKAGENVKQITLNRELRRMK